MLKIKKLVGNFNTDTLLVVETGVRYNPPQKWVKRIEQLWNEAKKGEKEKGRKIWNAKVYRLSGLKKKNGKYILYMGILDFKTHYASSYFTEEVKKLPFENRPNGMYVSSYVRTLDGKFIFGLKNFSIPKNRLHFLGGVLNEDEMKISSGQGLFDYFLKELREETGLNNDAISLIKGLKIFITINYKVAVLFETQLSITAKEFKNVTRPNFEHDRLVCINKDKIIRLIQEQSPRVGPIIQLTFPKESSSQKNG